MLRLLIALFLCTLTLHSVEGQECVRLSLYYGNNKSKLTKSHQRAIQDSLLSLMDSTGIYLIEIHGNTDDRHSDEYNLKLAGKRIDGVLDFVKPLTDHQAEFFTKNYGESYLLSEKNKLNRRVDIFLSRLNDDSTVTIYGSGGAKLMLNYRYFSRHGYCISEPELISDNSGKINSEFGGSVDLRLKTRTDYIVGCMIAEFRFPFEYFNSQEKIMIPEPIEFFHCTRPDTVDVKTSNDYTVSFDTLTNEYVVRHRCFGQKYGICCGTIDICENVRYMIPAEFVYHRALTFDKDSTILIDPEKYLRCPSSDSINCLGYFQGGQLMYLMSKNYKIPVEIQYSHSNLRLPYRIKYYPSIKDYKPINFTKSKLLIKTARKMTIDTLGFYLEPFRYFIPLSKVGKRRFRSKMIDFEFHIGNLYQNELQAIPFDRLRKRYIQRKDLYKIKVRRSWRHRLEEKPMHFYIEEP